jgi:hypothetical protein
MPAASKALCVSDAEKKIMYVKLNPAVRMLQGVMTQTLYTHMNKRNLKKECCTCGGIRIRREANLTPAHQGRPWAKTSHLC